MKISSLLQAVFLLLPLLQLTACGIHRIDTMNVLVRSDVIKSAEQEKTILNKAKVINVSDNRIKVLIVRGTPYERGYQQGVLLRDEVRDNLKYLHKKAIAKFKMPELFDEAFVRMMPHIPQRYIDEMHGLAHGSKLPLRTVWAVHMLPEIAEWSGKRNIKKYLKKMMKVDLGTSCSNIAVCKSATADGKMYALRVLDWGLHRISKAHEYPTIIMSIPEKGNTFANIGWAGFLGAVSGMNDQGITLGEMGYGSPENEHLRGIPMTFLLREVLQFADSVDSAKKILKEAKGTNSFVFVISDGKSKQSAMFVKDSERFVEFKPGQRVVDRKNDLPPVKDSVYAGHYQDKMISSVQGNKGKISPSLLMNKIVPDIAMPSNFQNVIYSPEDLSFWVSNAKSPSEPASTQPYFKFNMKEYLP